MTGKIAPNLRTPAETAVANQALKRQISVSKTLIKYDLMTMIGLLGAVIIIFAAMLLGGSPLIFIDTTSLVMVVLGTIAVTMISTSYEDVIMLPKILKWSIFQRSISTKNTAKKMIMLSEVARKRGLLILEGYIPDFKGDSYMQRCLGAISDGIPAKEIENLLKYELAAIANRHHRGSDILKRAADIAPAMGLIGTLVGLVQMLGKLDDPSSIGPAMAVALLTTFYGAILGSMILNPLATKLDRNSETEILMLRLKMIGTISIAKQENPRRLEMLLNTILPADQKIKYFS